VNRLSIREWGEEEARKKGERGERREKPPPIPTPLGHFTPSQFLLGTSSRGQSHPAGACPQATVWHETLGNSNFCGFSTTCKKK